MADSASAKPPRTLRATSNVPHSWELKSWEEKAPDVWPHTNDRAKWIARAYRGELVAAQALTRIGKTLVIVGAPYTRWLERRAQRVVEFTSNNPGLKPTRGRAQPADRA